ncbi:extracellular solute-binding protein [Yaniella flava]|uniref:extracellular solute-binding protein n=1 Tax=Yaniella flava TaxID=287930 RepID=UPI0031D9F0B8
MTSFGGDWEDAYVEAVVEPFEDETGASVELVTLYSADAMTQVTAQASAPQFDVVHFSGGQEAIAAEEGLISPINSEELTNFPDLAEGVADSLEEGQGPAIQVTPMGIIYHTEAIDEAPTTWSDILNDDYAGHVAFTDLTNAYGVQTLLAINSELGGTVNDVTPGMEAIGGNVSNGDGIVVATSPDLQAAFAQRNTWIAPYAQDYAFTLIEAGLPVEFTVPESGTTVSYVTANVVEGRENEDAATALIDYSLTPEAQEIFAESMRYTPVNTEVALSDEVENSVLAPEELDTVERVDPHAIDENERDWQDNWNRLITE